MKIIMKIIMIKKNKIKKVIIFYEKYYYTNINNN